MSTDVEISNMALSHIGVGKEIASLTENSAEARALNRFYEPAREMILRAAPWPCATRFSAALAVIAQSPTKEWAFSYRLPGDCLMVRRVISGCRTDSRQTRVPYRIATDDTGKLMYCDVDQAQIEYTVDITNSSMFDADLVLGFSALLGYLVVPRLSKGDPTGMGKRAGDLANQAVSKALANAINEEQPDQPTESEFIRARDSDLGVNMRGGSWSAFNAAQDIA